MAVNAKRLSVVSGCEQRMGQYPLLAPCLRDDRRDRRAMVRMQSPSTDAASNTSEIVSCEHGISPTARRLPIPVTFGQRGTAAVFRLRGASVGAEPAPSVQPVRYLVECPAALCALYSASAYAATDARQPGTSCRAVGGAGSSPRVSDVERLPTARTPALVIDGHCRPPAVAAAVVERTKAAHRLRGVERVAAATAGAYLGRQWAGSGMRVRPVRADATVGMAGVCTFGIWASWHD